MAEKQKNIAASVYDIILPTVTQLGYELWDVEYVKEGAKWFLRVTLDSENGIGIDDCETVHRAIDPILDEADPIETSYYLEVSSPGIERPLRTVSHFDKTVGARIQCKLYAARNNAKTLVGVLQGVNEAKDAILLATAEETITLPLGDIAKANVLFEGFH